MRKNSGWHWSKLEQVVGQQFDWSNSSVIQAHGLSITRNGSSIQTPVWNADILVHVNMASAIESKVTSHSSAATPSTAQTGFVQCSSIVRRIWGDPDLVLLIFAGSAAEFALNRSVDWLFFTGEIPRDPIG